MLEKNRYIKIRKFFRVRKAKHEASLLFSIEVMPVLLLTNDQPLVNLNNARNTIYLRENLDPDLSITNLRKSAEEIFYLLNY